MSLSLNNTGLSIIPGAGLSDAPALSLISTSKTPVTGLTLSGFDSNTNGIIAAMTANGSTPTGARQIIINNTVTALVTAGYYARLNRLGVIAAATTQQAAVDWITKTPGLTVNAGMTFTADQGYVGNGTSGFIDTAQDPTASSLMSQNSNSFGAATLSTRSAGADAVLIGNVQISGAFGLFPNSSAPSSICDDSNAPFGDQFTLPNPTVKGLWHISRTAATTLTTCINGISAHVAATASAAPTAGKSFWLAGWRNTDGTTLVFPSTDNVCLWFCGGAFSVPDMLGFATIMNTNYFTPIGHALF